MRPLLIATMLPSATVAAGDEANAAALLRRAARRGIAAEHVVVERAAEDVDADIFLLGGTGRESAVALADGLALSRLAARVANDQAAVLAVDAGFDALARTFVGPGGGVVRGLGILDVDVVPGRAVFSTVATLPNPVLGLPAMVGWISTDGRVRMGASVAPLAQYAVRLGRQRDAADGAVTSRVVATRLHGPVLAVNPELADLVLARVPGVESGGWGPLPEPEADRARAQRIAETKARRR